MRALIVRCCGCPAYECVNKEKQTSDTPELHEYLYICEYRRKDTYLIAFFRNKKFNIIKILFKKGAIIILLATTVLLREILMRMLWPN